MKDLPLIEYDFAVIDFETTGFRHSTAGVPPVAVEVAIVEVSKDGDIGEKWTTRFNPLRPIEPSASRVHGMTASMLENEPTFQDMLEEVKNRIVGKTLVAHNAEFESRILRNELSRFNGHGLRGKPFVFIDTVREMRSVAPNLPNHKLETVLDHYGIHNKSPHSALGDAEATAELFSRLLKSNQPLEATRTTLTSKRPSSFLIMKRIGEDYHVELELKEEYENENLWKKTTFKKPRAKPATKPIEPKREYLPPKLVDLSYSQPVTHEVQRAPYKTDISVAKSKSQMTYLILLSGFFGIFGVDRFASGKIVSGFVKLFTLGGFGFWWIIDYLLIVSRNWKINGERIASQSKVAIGISLAPMFFGALPITIGAIIGLVSGTSS